MHKIRKACQYTLLLIVLLNAAPFAAFAGTTCGDDASGTVTHTAIDFGCKGVGNGITDLTFGVIRFLTNGVGLVIVASMVYAGIQYSSSRGDPNATAQAINRIRANVFALILFAFAYALLNYIIPGQVLT